MVFIFRDCVCALKGSPSKLVSLHGEILFGSALEVPFFMQLYQSSDPFGFSCSEMLCVR